MQTSAIATVYHWPIWGAEVAKIVTTHSRQRNFIIASAASAIGRIGRTKSKLRESIGLSNTTPYSTNNRLGRLLAFSLVLIGLSGCEDSDSRLRRKLATEIVAELSVHDDHSNDAGLKQAVEVPTAIANFCGDCHRLPGPNSFVREVWYEEIEKGYEFYARSGRTDLTPPPLVDVLQFYRQHAPATLEFPPPAEVDSTTLSKFTLEEFRFPVTHALAPAVASIRWVRLEPAGVFRLVVCDMREGTVSLVTPSRGGSTREIIGRMGNPARATPCDLNRDGVTDFVVADLGSFNPYDHRFGSVVWLKGHNGRQTFESITLKDQLGRVADVAVGDTNQDGLEDILVAEFGHRKTGAIRRLLCDSESLESPIYSEQIVDIRPGSMQVGLADWNADGLLDFASITSQEFESLDLFLNTGRNFQQRPIWSGDDLTAGSIGFEMADLDSDGDEDIVCVNGDSFDNNFVNHSHGIQWLENQGELKFQAHRIIELPGAYRAIARDMDNDGDLDLLAVANLPTTVYPTSINASGPISLLLLEQVKTGTFEAKVLERGVPRYPALEASDMDGDGGIDIVVGSQLFDTDPPGSPAAKLPHLKIWWSQPQVSVAR